jgi:hypothetical protein
MENDLVALGSADAGLAMTSKSENPVVSAGRSSAVKLRSCSTTSSLKLPEPPTWLFRHPWPERILARSWSSPDV